MTRNRNKEHSHKVIFCKRYLAHSLVMSTSHDRFLILLTILGNDIEMETTCGFDPMWKSKTDTLLALRCSHWDFFIIVREFKKKLINEVQYSKNYLQDCHKLSHIGKQPKEEIVTLMNKTHLWDRQL